MRRIRVGTAERERILNNIETLLKERSNYQKMGKVDEAKNKKSEVCYYLFEVGVDGEWVSDIRDSFLYKEFEGGIYKKSSRKDDDKIYDIFMDTMMVLIEKYDCEKKFENYYNFVMDKKVKEVIRNYMQDDHGLEVGSGRIGKGSVSKDEIGFFSTEENDNEIDSLRITRSKEFQDPAKVFGISLGWFSILKDTISAIESIRKGAEIKKLILCAIYTEGLIEISDILVDYPEYFDAKSQFRYVEWAFVEKLLKDFSYPELTAEELYDESMSDVRDKNQCEDILKAVAYTPFKTRKEYGLDDSKGDEFLATPLEWMVYYIYFDSIGMDVPETRFSEYKNKLQTRIFEYEREL